MDMEEEIENRFHRRHSRWSGDSAEKGQPQLRQRIEREKTSSFLDFSIFFRKKMSKQQVKCVIDFVS